MAKNREKAVPSKRLSRFGRMARMASGVAAGMLSEGAKQIGQGNRPKIKDMLLTPTNAKRVANQLSTMRGAAMKVGQLLSMETREFLPPELADILAELRNRAFIMPDAQLENCMLEAYGPNWQERFDSFQRQPIAAASIGQVHRATTLDGDDIVLKIQYPGVRQSIDSDVDNIASLLRVTRLLPKEVEIDTILDDAKKQLHEEADYFQEAAYMQQFSNALKNEMDFVVPDYFEDLSTDKILAMSYVAGEPIENLETLNESDKNALIENLFKLMLFEFFDLRLMQTDANFANYLYHAQDKNIALLDFGASRAFSKTFVINYKRLLRAVCSGDKSELIDAADRLGYDASTASDAYQEFLIEVFEIALEPFAHQGVYNFKDARISERIAAMSDVGLDFKEFWRVPPSDILYLHRKIAGMYLLAARIDAEINLNTQVMPYLKKLALDS